MAKDVDEQAIPTFPPELSDTARREADLILAGDGSLAGGLGGSGRFIRSGTHR